MIKEEASSPSSASRVSLRESQRGVSSRNEDPRSGDDAEMQINTDSKEVPKDSEENLEKNLGRMLSEIFHDSIVEKQLPSAHQEEMDLLRKLSPGESLEVNMWRDKLARLVEAYSRLQQWELDVLTSQS
jgi:hypothetical protein